MGRPVCMAKIAFACGILGRNVGLRERGAMAGERVLIVEDDADINQIVATHLARRGYSCTQAFSGSEARLLVGSEGDAGDFPFDVVISDLMLPGLAGEELVGLIRACDAAVPVIIISARTAAADRIDLLKLGADDYLTKPFDLDELVARIEVQLRHRLRAERKDGERVARRNGGEGAAPAACELRFRDWLLNRDTRTLRVAGEPVELTRIEFNILEIMMGHPRHVFTKAELFEAAWGEPYAADDNTLNVHISNIRGKLKASGTDGYVKTVWGMGFKLVEA